MGFSPRANFIPTLAISILSTLLPSVERAQISPATGFIEPGEISTVVTPAAIAFRVSWPDQKIIRTTVGKLDSCQREEGIVKTALVIVGDAVSQSDFERSCLYDPDFKTEYRR